MKGSFAGVYIFDVPYYADKEYTYCIPEHLCKDVSLGSLVVVPFGGGNRYRTGVVSSLFSETQTQGIKPIISAPGGLFSIGELGIKLCLFMRENFFCTISDAVKTILPAGISVNKEIRYTLCENVQTQGLNADAQEIISAISKNGSMTENEICEFLSDGAKRCLSYLEKKNIVKKEQEISCRINEKVQTFARVTLSAQELECILLGGGTLTQKQREAVTLLAKEDLSTDELKQRGTSLAILRALEKKGLVELYTESRFRNPYAHVQSAQSEEFVLSSEQKSAYEQLLSLYMKSEPAAALLYGVTGSGKTNVVLKLCDKAFEQKRSVIYLVPEIALVNQALSLFSKRYGDNVLVIHSALSAGERTDAYKRAKESEFCIVIGTRSAIFTPVNNLSMVVMDEEQDSSYKSEMNPKYHARDIARFICAKTGAFLLLCSATPCLESFYKAKSGKYELVCLKNRYGDARLPNVIIEDMRGEPHFTEAEKDGKNEILPLAVSENLARRIEDTVKSGRQAILFMNRRGYQAFARCASCGYVFLCPNCSVSLTFHKNAKNHRHPEGEMLCHYCGFSSGVPNVCPVCASKHISFMGTGTQLVEEYLENKFENEVIRMDTDTTTQKLSCDKILNDFRERRAKVLIGTQMITKGHDFPDVSLVGVVSADSLLYMNDFRANERTFSLLTQVLGRAGRGKVSGTAVIQTQNPEHLTLQLAANQNYEAFYKDEIAFRRAAVFPPFCDIVTFELSSEDELSLSSFAKLFSKTLEELASHNKAVKMIVYGPFQAGIYKMLGRYRLRFILKCKLDKITRGMLSRLYGDFLQKLPESVRISVDTNPQNM